MNARMSALQQERWPVCPDTAFTEALANRALRVKICCQCLIKKQRGGLWRDALCIWRALLAKLLLQQRSRSIQIRWWSHLPSAEEEGRGIVVLSTCMEEGKVLAQGLDREGHLLAWTLLWCLATKPTPKLKPRCPAGQECAHGWQGESRGGDPTLPSRATMAPWDKGDHSRILSMTLLLETLIQFSH